MKWTTEKPTETGWYWIKDSHWCEGIIVRVNADTRKYYDGDLHNFPLNAKWAGPISVPEDE